MAKTLPAFALLTRSRIAQENPFSFIDGNSTHLFSQISNPVNIENDKWSPTLLYEVARRFGVSTQALIWRLDSIHRIDKKLFEHYKKNKPTRPYEPSAPLPHNIWLETLKARVKGHI